MVFKSDLLFWMRTNGSFNMTGSFNDAMNQHSGMVYNHAYGNNVRMNSSMARLPISPHDPYAIVKAAKIHRSAAAVCEASCIWSGKLPWPIHRGLLQLQGVPWQRVVGPHGTRPQTELLPVRRHPRGVAWRPGRHRRPSQGLRVHSLRGREAGEAPSQRLLRRG